MRTARRTAPILALATALGLAACGSETEAQKEVGAQAEAIEESYDAEAELVESLAEGAPEAEQNAAEARAGDLRQQGDAEREHLESMADELDELKEPEQQGQQ